MDDYALVLNAGSSSLKFCVFRRPAAVKNWSLESRGQIEGIGGASPRLSVKHAEGGSLAEQTLGASVGDAPKALDALAAWLRSMYGGARVLGVGHRVVHGGVHYDRPTVVSREVLAELYRLVPLAPLHQPHNLAAIEAVRERLPQVPQVACFDTSFHRGHSAVADLLPLPREIRQAGVQRYGFHGLSYEYIATVLPQVAPEIAKGRVIVAHLGSGASLCALKEGKSVDCSFGFTALDGLCMGTRPGALDPGAVLHLFQTLGLSAGEVEDILYKKSGLLGISSLSNDMRDLLGSDKPEARLAVDYFVFRAAKEIGALTAVLGGIDGLVFTAGIGENSAEIRRRICESSAWLGVEVDAEANARGGPRISAPKSKVSTWVISTNEELMIARHMGMLLGLV
jgi:acetate kinase